MVSCCKKMLETIKYLLGSNGPSGYGSKSTAEQVTHQTTFVHDLLQRGVGGGGGSCFTAIITGATSGIGAETARVLAMRGARLVLPARNLKAAEDTKARILSEFPDAHIMVMSLDLSSFASVRSFVDSFLSQNLPLNLLINNAGKFSYSHGMSEDGIEMTFATNYLGHFLLTKLLMKKMIETAKSSGVQGRIVNVSSSIHTWFSGDLLQSLRLITSRHSSNNNKSGSGSGSSSKYDPTRAYALSKLANVLHTKELARRLKEEDGNVTVNCVHPGIVRTRLTRDREGILTDLVFFLASKLVKTIPQAAATTCYVATHPTLSNVTGNYFSDCNKASTSKLGSSIADAARLWDISELMVSGHHHHPSTNNIIFS